MDLNPEGDYISLSSVPLSSYPLTFYARLKGDSSAEEVKGIFITDSATDDNFWGISLKPDNYFVYYFRGGNSSFLSTGSPNAGQWYTLVAVSRASNDHSLWIDGSESTSSTNSTPSGLDRADIGYVGDATPGDSDGKIAEVAVWDVALTDSEVALLSNSEVRRMPLQIRSSSLKGYWALDDFGDGTDLDTSANGYMDMSSNANHGQGVDADGDSDNIADTVLSYP